MVIDIMCMSCIKWTHRSTRWLTGKITYKLYNTRKFCESKICWEWQKEKSWAKKRHQAKSSLSLSFSPAHSFPPLCSFFRSLLSILHVLKLSFGVFACWRSLSLLLALSRWHPHSLRFWYCFTWIVWQRRWRARWRPPGPQPGSPVRAYSPGCIDWRPIAVLSHRRRLRWRDLKGGL